MGFKSISAVAGSLCVATSSASSATTLPPVSVARVQSSAVQTSSSLQDFSAYDKVGSSDDVSVINVSGVVDVERPLIYHEQEDDSLYTPKGLKSSNITRTGYCFKLIVSGILGGLILFLLYVGLHWGRLHWSSEKLQYSIVLDCGSTSTRVQVYAWTYKDSSGNGQLPVVIHRTFQSHVPPVSFSVRKGGQRKESRAYHRMETEPGLHKLLSNATGIKAAIEPLLQWAEQQVPRADHGSTPLFLLATAGMRSLESGDAEWLLDKAWAILERSPFLCRRSWVKVISGAEEAYYGWVSLNYNFGRLGQITRQPTFGTLDLGGSSLQVTFESEGVQNKDYEVNLSVGTTEHQLYAFSHAGFGLNDAFDKSVALVLEQLEEPLTIMEEKRRVLEHPCLHAGFQKQYRCAHCKFLSKENPATDPDPAAQQTTLVNDQMEFTLVGKPNWESCKLLVSAIVNNASKFLIPPSSQSVDCVNYPCALGKYEPVPQGKFYALSGFFVVYKFFGLGSDAGFRQLLEQGQAFCEKPWKTALDSVVPQPLIEHYCFRAPYVVSLLQDGLHLKEEQITVGSGDMTWTLGAALLEAGAFTKNNGGHASRDDGFHPATRGLLTWDAGILSVFILIMIFLILFTVTHFVNCVPFMGLKVQSTLSLLGLSRFSSLLLTRLRIGKVETALQNGDGRAKMPHSPAPIGTPQDQSQPKFSSAGGKSMLELSKAQQVVGGYTSGFKLSSRRTQSRDDLIKYCT